MKLKKILSFIFMFVGNMFDLHFRFILNVNSLSLQIKRRFNLWRRGLSLGQNGATIRTTHRLSQFFPFHKRFQCLHKRHATPSSWKFGSSSSKSQKSARSRRKKSQLSFSQGEETRSPSQSLPPLQRLLSSPIRWFSIHAT